MVPFYMVYKPSAAVTSNRCRSRRPGVRAAEPASPDRRPTASRTAERSYPPTATIPHGDLPALIVLTVRRVCTSMTVMSFESPFAVYSFVPALVASSCPARFQGRPHPARCALRSRRTPDETAQLHEPRPARVETTPAGKRRRARPHRDARGLVLWCSRNDART